MPPSEQDINFNEEHDEALRSVIDTQEKIIMELRKSLQQREGEAAELRNYPRQKMLTYTAYLQAVNFDPNVPPARNTVSFANNEVLTGESWPPGIPNVSIGFHDWQALGAPEIVNVTISV